MQKWQRSDGVQLSLLMLFTLSCWKNKNLDVHSSEQKKKKKSGAVLKY